MFPETKSRKTSRFSGKQDELFPLGSYIKCTMLKTGKNPKTEGEQLTSQML